MGDVRVGAAGANSKKAQAEQGQQNSGYSVAYRSIKEEIETTWPAWNVALYNSSVSTSKHAKKLKVKEG